ncbi:hypothetical protein S40285_07427 [Stachybotrys chlorohalonatus IBT 40285]|uniref:Uncharacterized protein n=1 Tax=Stachybotrys chlorohalonatus (strain IBT 40285) TaxID=1283841 RepID=A0A084QAP5_STAC4|nr:hypothetical protein S40285_07427 [Stachybotrys chlorohalonata IBT 40285]
MSDSNPDPGGVSIVVGTVKLIVNALISIPWLRYLSLAGRVLVWPLRIIIVPFSLVARVLLVVFSPLIYVLSFVLSCISTTFAFIASLEPLYNFFAVAASIGIFSGLLLAVSSGFITSYLGMYEDPRDSARPLKKKGLLEDVPSFRDESSSNETEWHWPDPSPTRRRPASSLVSQIIHEEEDDDSDVAY